MGRDRALRAVAGVRPVGAARVALIGLAGAMLLAGCGITDSITESTKIDYKSATKVRQASLEVPPDLITPRGDERFQMDRPEDRTASTFQKGQGAQSVPAVAADRRVLPDVPGARIERAGGQRWLVVDQPAERIWPVLREFWQENGFVVDIDRPEAGILETDWAENRAKLPQDIIRATLGKVLDSLYSTGERDRFRVRLERTASGGTEIYLTHRGLIEVSNPNVRDSTIWTPRPADPELEAEFLRRLLVRLGSDREQAKAVVAGARPTGAAATAAAPQKVRLVTGEPGTERVEIDESFDRAWRRVGLALDRGGFTVEDRDRSQGVYFVRYIDPEAEGRNAKPGFFARLFSSGNKPASTRQYRVTVAGAGEATKVGVLTREGQPLSSAADREVSGKMLALLVDQLKQ